MGLDLKELDRKVKDALAKETPESLKAWLVENGASTKYDKIIFLDIDGVLNDDAYWETINRSEVPKTGDKNEDSILFHISMINPAKVKLLNKITGGTGAKIVVSSTWRNHPFIKEILQRSGVTGEIIGITPYATQECCSPGYENNGRALRGIEILFYMDKHYPQTWSAIDDKAVRPELESYAIIDDDADMLYWQKDNFFKTDGHIGLTEELAGQIIKHLIKGA